jgi:hypothetical protein
MPGRSNGLQALAYAPLTDLDPRLADSVLDALRQAGIAAYVVPSPGETGGYRDIRLPERPKDRLWVDASAVDRARAVVDTTVPPGDPPPLDEDAAWRAIVASFEDGPATPVPPWPVSEDLDDGPARTDAPPTEVRGRVLRRFEANEPATDEQPGEEPADIEPPGGESRVVAPDDAAAEPAAARDEDAEHFVPPPPPPLPRANPVTAWAWVALLGGVGLLLAPAIVGWDLEGWMALLAVAGIVGGFVTLVARLGDGAPRDSGPDDGAVV